MKVNVVAINRPNRPIDVIPREGVESSSDSDFVAVEIGVIPREGVESEKLQKGLELMLGDPERGS